MNVRMGFGELTEMCGQSVLCQDRQNFQFRNIWKSKHKKKQPSPMTAAPCMSTQGKKKDAAHQCLPSRPGGSCGSAWKKTDGQKSGAFPER